jgi:hypothetical protein
MLSIFQSIRNEIKAAFEPADPKRFSTVGATPWNWNGEFEKRDDRKGGPILTNRETQTFEFGQTGLIEIPEYLTELDVQELRKRNLDPNNPAYAICKAYFSKMRFCTKTELAANSGDDYNEGIMPETAAKVLAAFRAYLVDKPTF